MNLAELFYTLLKLQEQRISILVKYVSNNYQAKFSNGYGVWIVTCEILNVLSCVNIGDVSLDIQVRYKVGETWFNAKLDSSAIEHVCTDSDGVFTLILKSPLHEFFPEAKPLVFASDLAVKAQMIEPDTPKEDRFLLDEEQRLFKARFVDKKPQPEILSIELHDFDPIMNPPQLVDIAIIFKTVEDKYWSFFFVETWKDLIEFNNLTNVTKGGIPTVEGIEDDHEF